MTVFDEKIAALDIVEEHAASVLRLENDEATKLLRVYQKVATQLRSRLQRLPKDIFTAQQVRVTLVQLDAAISALQSDLKTTTARVAEATALKGVGHLVAEATEFNAVFRGALQPISIDLVRIALDSQKRLLENFQVSIDTYSATLRTRISNSLTSMIVERVTPEVMYQRMVADDGIGKFFDGEAWRLRRIVRTEVHGMYSAAKASAMGRWSADQPELRKALYQPVDARTAKDSLWLAGEVKAGRLNGIWEGAPRRLRPAVSETFAYTWVDGAKRYRRVFFAPPDRPNDRSILIPFHPSWGAET